jgi:hypothetical protein
MECRMNFWSTKRGGDLGVQNEIEGSQTKQRSTNGIEECISQQRSTNMGWARSVEIIIGAPAGIEELPSRAKEYQKVGIDCGM